jgi:hypothetical protein
MAEKHAANALCLSPVCSRTHAGYPQAIKGLQKQFAHSMRQGSLSFLMRRGLVLMIACAALDGAPVQAYVALMAGQQARPLQGSFNSVPVLHSNQPEEVEGPGILINTAPGMATATDNGQLLPNAEFTFNGEFGVHLHHKYFPSYRNSIRSDARRTQLTLALILVNPSHQPVTIRFDSGAVRNSFEAPYLGDFKFGVKPLGPRPWNTGPGDATAIQMLRGQLDRRLQDEITIPPQSRMVLFRTELPALGIANALLRGRSNGPFHMAVVAAKTPREDYDLFAVLDSGQLAPGRVYLNRIAEINNRTIFSRVGGVAIGDSYQAKLTHDLGQGPLHVPLTSTERHNFGTREIQVNPLASRMLDSSLNNVGTYGVRFDIDLDLRGSGSYELVLSHPTPSGGKNFTAFRGSLQVRTEQGLQEMHVGMRSGQSLSLTTLDIKPGVANPVRVSLVYPADATPGHLLSVVPAGQLARLRLQERQLELARTNSSPIVAARSRLAPPPSPDTAATESPDSVTDAPLVLVPAHYRLRPLPLPALAADQLPAQRQPILPPPPVLPAIRPEQTLVERYQQALEAQQVKLRGLMDP